jgi:hypothetical protein
MLLTYFLNDFEMVPVVPVITGITLGSEVVSVRYFTLTYSIF